MAISNLFPKDLGGATGVIFDCTGRIGGFGFGFCCGGTMDCDDDDDDDDDDKDFECSN